MRQIVVDYASGDVRMEEVPMPMAIPGHVLVQTAFSVVSTGTERTVVETAAKSLARRALDRPDQMRQVLQSLRERGLRETVGRVRRTINKVVPLGYCFSGLTTEAGDLVDDLPPGSPVAGVGWGAGTHAEWLAPPRNLVVRVPDGVSLRDAAFTGIGAIALQGVRTAEIQLGDRVLIIGLGLVGLLAGQISKVAGCRVAGLDLNPSRVARARDLGFDQAWDARSEGLDRATDIFTDHQGFDAVVIATHTNTTEPLLTAARLSRVRGRVSIVGVLDISIPRDLMYEKELRVTISRAFGPGSYDPAYQLIGIDYPSEFVRWPVNRNLAEFLQWVASGQILIQPLITHQYVFGDGPTAFMHLKRGDPILAAVLTYDNSPPAHRPDIVQITPTSKRIEKDVGIGFIGAGSFARGVLLPLLRRDRTVNLVGLANASPVSSSVRAREFGFRYATTEVQALLSDPSINALFIATRHNQHARMAVDGLRAGKHVFVEKPLALSVDELKQVIQAQAESAGTLFVGFNRRFASVIRQLKARFTLSKTPLMIHYRVNAGTVPRTHWPQDPLEGGGRLLGEVCHFIDTIQYLCGCSVTVVESRPLRPPRGGSSISENVTLVLEMTNGSLATLLYTSLGSPAIPKERLEIFGDGAVGWMEGFRRGGYSSENRQERLGTRRQDYGHEAEISAFLSAVRGAREETPSFTDILTASLATIRAQQSLERGGPVPIDLHEVLGELEKYQVAPTGRT